MTALLVLVTPARDERAVVAVNDRERAEAVVFQLEDPVRMISGLPVEKLARFGAVAPAAVAFPAWIRGALKHEATGDPERQAAKDVPGELLDSLIAPKPFGLAGAAVGAAGVLDAPQPASTHVVTIEPTEATNVRMALLLGLHVG